MLEKLKARKIGYTQSQIAATTKLSPQYVSDLVLGVRGKRSSYAAVSAIQKQTRRKNECW